MSKPTHRWLPLVLAMTAGLGAAVAIYFYSFGALLENDCALGREGACDALMRTIRFSLFLGGASLVPGIAAVVVAGRRRHRTLG